MCHEYILQTVIINNRSNNEKVNKSDPDFIVKEINKKNGDSVIPYPVECMLSCDMKTLSAIFKGKLKPMTAFLSGKLKLEGKTGEILFNIQ